MDIAAIAEVVLLPIIGGLLGWRGGSSVKNQNLRDAMASRHDANLLDERNKAVADLDAMRDERDKERELRTYFEGRIRRRDVKIAALEEALREFAAEQYRSVARWMPKETTFSDLDDEPTTRKPPLPPPRLPRK